MDTDWMLLGLALDRTPWPTPGIAIGSFMLGLATLGILLFQRLSRR